MLSHNSFVGFEMDCAHRLMNHQTGEDFVFQDRQTESVVVGKLIVSDFTAKACVL